MVVAAAWAAEVVLVAVWVAVADSEVVEADSVVAAEALGVDVVVAVASEAQGAVWAVEDSAEGVEVVSGEEIAVVLVVLADSEVPAASEPGPAAREVDLDKAREAWVAAIASRLPPAANWAAFWDSPRIRECTDWGLQVAGSEELVAAVVLEAPLASEALVGSVALVALDDPVASAESMALDDLAVLVASEALVVPEASLALAESEVLVAWEVLLPEVCESARSAASRLSRRQHVTPRRRQCG